MIGRGRAHFHPHRGSNTVPRLSHAAGRFVPGVQAVSSRATWGLNVKPQLPQKETFSSSKLGGEPVISLFPVRRCKADLDCQSWPVVGQRELCVMKFSDGRRQRKTQA